MTPETGSPAAQSPGQSPEKPAPVPAAPGPRRARALMFQGTGSDVGKSLVVAGLCRAFARRGLRVRPFKPQNMSNNAAVTADGGEIGRAQALQARAAGVAASVHMNPVLLKPQSETGAQVVVQGRVWQASAAAAYQRERGALLPAVLESFGRLAAEADLVLVEGAGSASEINLRAGDIANMGFAQAAGVPVVLIGDIERGGVIASLVGTAAVLEPADAALIGGFIVNRFRGDPALFAQGMTMIAARTGWQPLGLVPHFAPARRLPAEDAMALAETARWAHSGRDAGRVRIAVPVLPRIANFDDLDPLLAEPGVELLLLHPGDVLPADVALVLLPGSKTTIADLAVLRESGLAADIVAHRRRGGHVLGLCGGYQMLGRHIADPDGIEGPPGRVEGLGLLDVETVLTSEKRLEAVTGTTADGAALTGYEMHMGATTGPDCARPFARLRGSGLGESALGETGVGETGLSDGRPEGAVSADGRVCGSYVHGLFADDAQRARWLQRLGAPPSDLQFEAGIEAALDALASHLEQHLDLDTLLALAR